MWAPIYFEALASAPQQQLTYVKAFESRTTNDVVYQLDAQHSILHNLSYSRLTNGGFSLHAAAQSDLLLVSAVSSNGPATTFFTDVVNTSSWTVIRRIEYARGPTQVGAVAVNAAGTTMYSGSTKGAVLTAYDVATGQAGRKLNCSSCPSGLALMQAVVNPTDERLLYVWNSAPYNDTIEVLSTTDGSSIASFVIPNPYPGSLMYDGCAIDISADGSQLGLLLTTDLDMWTFDERQAVVVIDTATGKQLYQHKLPPAVNLYRIAAGLTSRQLADHQRPQQRGAAGVATGCGKLLPQLLSAFRIGHSDLRGRCSADRVHLVVAAASARRRADRPLRRTAGRVQCRHVQPCAALWRGADRR